MNPHPYRTPLLLSTHAQQRMTERDINFHQILFVLQHGKKKNVHKGRFQYQLRQKDIPPSVNVGRMYDPLIGSTVILDRYRQVVITVYRSHSPVC